MHRTSLFTRFTLGLVCALLIMTFFAAALPQQALAAAPQATCAETYHVKEGETIYRIARKFKLPAVRIAKANNLSSPYTLKVGQSLCIPEAVDPNINVTFTANMTGTGLGVNASGLRKEVVFYVRVRENDTSSFVKVGSVKSDRTGKVDARLQLPKDLQNKTFLTVCLKNAFNDQIVCTRGVRR